MILLSFSFLFFISIPPASKDFSDTTTLTGIPSKSESENFSPADLFSLSSKSTSRLDYFNFS